MTYHRLFITALLGVLLPVSILAAHQDDPKIKDRIPPYKGAGYRADVPGSRSSLVFDSDNVLLRAWLPLGDFGNQSSGNDCWGYVSPSGREYALIGLSNGTGVVEVTDPGNPQIIAVLSGPSSIWRDIKIYQTFMYAVSEGGGGIQVFNLVDIDSGVIQTLSSAGSGSTHNVAIDEESGFLYRTGGGGSGLLIYDLSNPAAPVQVGSWTDRYVHDAHVVTYTSGPYAGRQIAFCCAGFNNGYGDTGLTIVDVTNKSNTFIVSQAYYTNAAYSHQGWLSEDRQLFYLNDELDEQNFGTLTTTRVIDVSDISNPSFVSTFTSSSSSIDHNLYTHNGMIFESNYRSGLRVFDAADPLNPVQIGFFDTWPGDDNANFNGLWSVYPFFPSGTIIGSDIEKGLFVWELGQLDPCSIPMGSCPNDIDSDGTVGVNDVLAIIGDWGNCGDGSFRPIGDVNGDCCSNISDLLQVIAVWNTQCTPLGSCCFADGSCQESSDADCLSGGGTYSGDDTTCAGTSCPGAGDECANAIAASLGQTAFETLTATPSTPSPSDAMCLNSWLNWAGSADIWISWTATFSGVAHFTTCDASSFDTSMVLYEGTCSNQVACNGDATSNAGCQSYYSAIDYSVTLGETYFIRIGGWEGAIGTGTLTIE